MKVRELIEKLQEQDQDAEVLASYQEDIEHTTLRPATGVVRWHWSPKEEQFYDMNRPHYQPPGSIVAAVEVVAHPLEL